MKKLLITILFLTLYGCDDRGRETDKIIEVYGEIGSFLSKDVNLSSASSILSIGNGLYLDGTSIKGWPSKSGEYSYSTSKGVFKISIKPMEIEIKNSDVNSFVYLLWDTPQSNKIILKDEDRNETLLAQDDGGVKWQVNVDLNSNVMSWINFPALTGNDQIVFKNFSTGLTSVIEENGVIHRKPIYSDGYIYWYQESLNQGSEREIGIYKIDLNSEVISKVIASNYPNTITDFDVTEDGIVSVIIKNYDQQRSEIQIINGDDGYTYFKDNSFIQNISAYKNKGFYFEIKEHDKEWQVMYHDTSSKISSLISNQALIYELKNDGVITKSIIKKTDVKIVYDELKNRYSPEIIGLSRYNNKFGTLSISEAPIMRSLINIASKSNNQNYWYEVAERASNILKRTDNKLGIYTYDRQSSSQWSLGAFGNNHSVNIPYLVHDSSILDSLLQLAKQMDKDNILKLRYGNMYNDIIKIFEKNYDEHIKYLVTSSDDKFGIVESGEAYFIFPPGSPYEWDGVNLPFNMMNSYVRPLLIYSEITGNKKYKNLAISIGTLFKRHLRNDIENKLVVWPYWWGLYDLGWTSGEVSSNTPIHVAPREKGLSDVDHSSLDIRAVNSLFKRGLVFDYSDITRLSNTMKYNVDDNDYRSPLLIDGSIKSANYNSIEYLWAEVSEFNDEANDILKSSLSYFPYVQDSYTPTARFELVGLSHLIKNNR